MRFTRRLFVVCAVSLLTSITAFTAGCGETTPEAGNASGAPSAGASPATSGETPKELVLGFTPAAEATKVGDYAKPLAEHLGKELGIPVKTFTSTDYSGLVEAMGSGKVDIGAVPPLAYVLASDQQAAKVILKVQRKDKTTGKPTLTYRAMFVAKAGSGIKKIEDAKGKRMAFVDPSSTSGYLFPAAYLKAKGYDPESFFSQLIYAGSHDRAVQSVYNGDVDVAACYDDVRDLLVKNGVKDAKEKVVIVEYTGEIPNDTISVRANMDEALTNRIKSILIAYAKTEEGKKTLDNLYQAVDLVEAQDSDYDSVREVAKSMDVQLSMFSKDKKPASGAPSPAPSAAKAP
ncbi:MAG: phosphate/phosphite/phosphonate ABC transporter substrate-binding protein [Capsulimonadales bacterium]|nr:phosphate/phosphite/phosphonate ABC transporter substrate-binding protein [Capsulimonadales bacterium]